MTNAETIRGSQISVLLQELEEDNTLVNLRVLGKNYSHLTMVTGAKKVKGKSFFRIDYPAGFKQVIDKTGSWRINFEFTGRDKVPYIFKTSEGEISEDGIWICFPEVIQREQRRKNFRIQAPVGTVFYFELNSQDFEMGVIDISLEGALVTLKKGVESSPLLKVGQTLKDARFKFPSNREELSVAVKEALVRRVETGPVKGRNRYAIQLTKMERTARRDFKDIIYKTERRILRKRVGIDL